MNSSKKILCFSISDASGHKSAMDAIINSINHYNCHCEELQATKQSQCISEKSLNNSKIECIGKNFFNYLPKILVKTIDGAYYSVIDKKPGIWSFLRDNVLVKKIVTPFQFLFCFFSALSAYFKLLRKNKFDVIVCTQSFPCVCMSILKKFRLIKSKLIAVITDYNINPYWINKEVDYYIIPHQSLQSFFLSFPRRRESIELMTEQNKIKPLGIPIDLKFTKKTDTKKLAQELKVDINKYIVLILGGSLGLRMEDTIESLIQDEDLFLIIGTGRNEDLKQKLQSKYKNKKNLCLLGFVSNINELMDLSDVLVCKPGGVTIAEALAKGIKMIVVNPIPGQEELNKDFLVKNNLAFYAENTDELINILNQEKNKGKYKKIISKFAFPNSADNLAEFILSFLL
jgi:processive 1,2-diacylglycerol beta-glucosyltransferase